MPLRRGTCYSVVVPELMTRRRSPLEEDFVLGEWTVFPRRQQIRRGTEVRRLEPKVMQVLTHLAAGDGRTVTRQELLDGVWGDVHVVERVINRSIWELRRALDDDPRLPRYVETIPKRGYRLVAAVEPLEEPSTGGGVRRWRGISAVVGLALAAILVAVLAWRTRSARPPAAPTAVQPLTRAAGWDYDPALSPAGELLAYVAATPDTGSWDLQLLRLGDDASRRLTDHEGSEGHPAWSPDGRRIAYYRRPAEGTQLWVRDVAGDEARWLADVAAPYPEIDWSPDGLGLAFRQHLALDGPFAIHLLDLGSGLQRRLTAPPTGWRGDGHPRFSPGGDRLAFVRARVEGVEDLWLLDLTSGAERQVTRDAAPILGLTWAHDEVLYVASRRGGASEIWRLELDNGEIAAIDPLGLAGWRPGSPSWRRGRIAFVSWAGDANLWRVTVPAVPDASDVPVEQTRIVDSTAWDFHPAISPAGDRLAFTSNRSGSFEIWVRELASGAERRLTGFGGPFTGTPRWSPDGASLVFDSRPDGHADLFRVGLLGGVPERLTDHPADDLWATWTSDGAIVFASNRSGEWQLWRRSPAGEVARLTRRGGLAPKLGDNGSFYYLRPLGRGLYRAPADPFDEAAAELVVGGVTEAEAGSWTPLAGGVAIVRRGTRRGEPNRLVLHPPGGGPPRLLWQSPLGVPMYDAALAAFPNGRELIIGLRERPESDLYLATLGGEVAEIPP